MSDFLTNLAARALGTPTLRPRTRSRFEPEAGTSPWIEAPAAAEPIVTTAPSDIAQPSVPIAGPIPSRADSSPRAVHASIAASPRRESEALPRIERRESSMPEATMPRLNREAMLQHSTSTTHTDHHTTERVIERAVEHHHNTTVRVERNESTTVRVADAPRAGEATIATTQPREEAKPPHRYDTQPPRVEREQHRETPLGREPERQRPRVETAPSVAASEPVIHVSIGRVEVRAAAPASTSQRARTRNAPMTIEDYAARRNAKGRP